MMKTTSTLSEQQHVFNEFWDIYDQHYPLMHRKNINWQKVYNVYANQITSDTNDEELFNYFQDIINTVLQDGHAELIYNNTKQAIFKGIVDNNNIQTMLMQQNNLPTKIKLVASTLTVRSF